MICIHMQFSKVVSLWLVLLVLFLDWMGLGLVYPMFSSMLFSDDSFVGPEVSAATRGWYLGILLATMSVAQFFSGPILGGLSDQKGRRGLLLISLVLGVVGYGFCALGVWMRSIVVLIAARFVVGLAAGNGSIVNATVADVSTHANKAKHFGLVSMACGVGFTVGPFLGGKLSEYGFEVPFIVAGCAILLNFVLVLLLFQETHLVRRNVKIKPHEGLYNLVKAFKTPGLRAIFFAVLFYCFGWSFFYEFIPVTWIADFAFDSGQIGYFYAYGAGIYALSSGLLIRPIVGRFRQEPVFFYTLVTLGIVILLALESGNSFWIWIYLPIVNFLCALLFPTSSTIVSDASPSDAQGESLGILQSVQAAAFAFSPLAAGTFLGAHPHMPMLVGGIAMLLAAVVFGILARKEIFIGKS